MAGYLIDTNVLIDHLRGDDQATAAINKLYLTAEPVMTSVICMAEIYANVRPKEQAAVDEVFYYIRPLPIDDGIAARAGAYMKRLRKSHSVTMPDALIAATAAANKMTLITGNTRHFPLKDLKTKKPTNLF